MRWFQKIIALAFAAMVWISATEAAPLQGSRPNIVLVITDDQGYGPLGRHGHPWIQTPHLDRLHDASLRFTRFLVSPTCAPTRSALMTGRHVRHLPVFENGWLVGMVSIGDLVKAIISDQKYRIEQYENYVRGVYPA